MSVNKRLDILLEEINKTLLMLEKLDSFYHEFLATDFGKLGENNTSAIVVAEVFADYYTCAETLFVRISQFFENELIRDKWHSDLLHKMTLEIKSIRPRVLNDHTYQILSEFLKFRHFKRYYFKIDYDWDKLKFLQKKYDQVKPMLNRDLMTFIDRLNELKE